MSLVVKFAAVAKAVRDDDFVRARRIHKGNGLAPAALIEIAGGPCVMPRVRHMAATRKTADVPRPIAGGHKIGDERLKARRKLCGNRDRNARRGLNGDEAGWVDILDPRPVPPPSTRKPHVMARARNVMDMGAVVTAGVMPVRGLRRDGRDKRKRKASRGENGPHQVTLSVVWRFDEIGWR